MKSLRFVGRAQEEISVFPRAARARAGYELFLVQTGRDPSDWKPMRDVGAGACEIRVRDASGAFRIIYVAKFRDAVYVLHAFQKKTEKTSREDIELAKQRYRVAKEFSEGDGNG